MKAVHLRTEYLDRPIGLGIPNPRFFWQCEGGILQSAYQIVCRRGSETVWNSGLVESSSMTHIPYKGVPLHSRDRIFWSVTLWDENGQPGETAESWFELGLLDASDWSAQWIAGNVKDQKNVRYPADCFQKQFSLNGELDSARLYITTCGLYEARINGKPAGEFCLAPGSTDYRKRIQYQTYDVTALLQEENTLEVELADGWYRGSVGAMGLTHAYGRRTKLLFQMELRYMDGRQERVVSDGTVRWSNDGPIRFADLKDGETIDAARHPSYRSYAHIEHEKLIPTASDNVFPRMKERFQATPITTPSGKTVLDFGQNIAGFVEFRVKAGRGQVLRLRMGEMLDEAGEFTQKNIQLEVPSCEVGRFRELAVISGAASKVTKELHMSPEQSIKFTCSGGEDFYRTKFAIFGFRYALVEADFPIDSRDFWAIAVYSDMEPCGMFQCSHPLVERLYQNTLWSMKGNFLDVPTDCPTRERLGWTGDAQIFFKTGAYMMDTAAFFRKWLRDMQDAQAKDGTLPAVLPYSRADMMYKVSGNSVGWADAMVLIPWRYYEMYGDRQLLENCWPMMKRYADYMIAHTGHKKKKDAKADPNNRYVYEKGFHLGEWLEPEEFVEKIGTDTAAAATKMLHTEECTAYLHYTMEHMAQAARLLGDVAGAERYQEYADGAARAYDALFLSPIPDTDRQAKLVRPLALGVVPNQKRETVQDRLALAVTNRDYRIGTGFLSTPFVLPVLTEMGRADLAYQMLECEQSPSWLAEVKAGATTIWETWEGDVSRNHYSPGAVCEWLFHTMAGIRPNCERRFILQPTPGGTLTWVKTSWQSVYGRVESSWERRGAEVFYEFTIPANTTADLYLDGIRHELGPGTHSFTVKTDS